jgi:hypothetical protein
MIAGPPVPLAVRAARDSGLARPTVKQLAYYRRLVESPVFTPEERERALAWLETRATLHMVKDQLDWLRGEVVRRTPGAAGAVA